MVEKVFWMASLWLHHLPCPILFLPTEEEEEEEEERSAVAITPHPSPL